ncbi:hypothetical protein CONPUDRAFT_152407 [Coniophora puteana RWD-64-598 SS2]|uniref:Uncharacterized protein n=1 Tax=Coniophora puteana (strain RWD-64-598) TaxID=741705 RepID=A0A5M3MW84_CONPW|nr:uncharacterized protein CONPUDRAFT_152407 [Coniophora puteana RWD-64-598 SS2]EIW83376.1 hypothetical protein CONPUDRAFT_152407 [Coniophora puteana RWD-64-598 SS2]
MSHISNSGFRIWPASRVNFPWHRSEQFLCFLPLTPTTKSLAHRCLQSILLEKLPLEGTFGLTARSPSHLSPSQAFRSEIADLHELFPVSEYPYPGDNESLSFSDAAAMGKFREFIITSPNMEEIYEPFVFEAEEVKVRADGRFGVIDPFQWPQLYSQRFEFAVCIQRKDVFYANEVKWAAWQHLHPDDITKVPGQPHLHQLKHGRYDRLCELVNQVVETVTHWIQVERGGRPHRIAHALRKLRNALQQLNSPMLRRDIVALYAEVQRGYLSISAFFSYLRDAYPIMRNPDFYPAHVNRRWMGAFTTDPVVCERLYLAGVPVWFIRLKSQIPRNIKIKRRVALTHPEHIVRINYYDERAHMHPFPPLCLPIKACDDRINQVLQGYEATSLEGVMQLQELPAQGAPGYGGNKRYKVQGRHADKTFSTRTTWYVVANEYTPHVPSLWSNALETVLLNHQRQEDIRKSKNQPAFRPTDLVSHGHRFPDPCSLVTMDDPERMTRMIVNWLQVRNRRISDVNQNPFVSQPTGQHWRDLLDGKIMDNLPQSQNKKQDKKRKDREKGRERFGRDVITIPQSGSFWEENDTITWQGTVLRPIDLANEHHWVKMIVWEAAELNFRFELLALDHVMAQSLWARDPEGRKREVSAVFPGHGGLTRQGQFLPDTEKDVGLSSRHPSAASEAWEKLRVLISVWEGASQYPPIACKTLADLSAAASPVARAYIEAFHYQTGRAPIVPFAFPFP